MSARLWDVWRRHTFFVDLIASQRYAFALVEQRKANERVYLPFCYLERRTITISLHKHKGDIHRDSLLSLRPALLHRPPRPPLHHPHRVDDVVEIANVADSFLELDSDFGCDYSFVCAALSGVVTELYEP